MRHFQNALRAWCGIVAAACLIGMSPLDADAQPNDFKVTLLGTGSPRPDFDRFSMSTLVQAGGMNLMFDVGRGSAIRLWQIGVPLGSIDAVFLTHYHSDHTSGLPDLWLTGGIDVQYGRRRQALSVFGPRGVVALTNGIGAAWADDVKIRIADEGLSPEVARFDAHEFSGNGTVVFERNGVKVIAFEVDHGEKIKPAYGYRVDYRGHSVAISGDTRRSENPMSFARGVDLLIHEVATFNEQAHAANPGFQAILAHHVTPGEAGEVFASVKPKLAVYSHILFTSDAKFPRPTVEDLLQQTRKTYSGPLIVGKDLMSFTIGDSVDRHAARSELTDVKNIAVTGGMFVLAALGLGPAAGLGAAVLLPQRARVGARRALP